MALFRFLLTNDEFDYESISTLTRAVSESRSTRGDLLTFLEERAPFFSFNLMNYVKFCEILKAALSAATMDLDFIVVRRIFWLSRLYGSNFSFSFATPSSSMGRLQFSAGMGSSSLMLCKSALRDEDAWRSIEFWTNCAFESVKRDLTKWSKLSTFSKDRGNKSTSSSNSSGDGTGSSAAAFSYLFHNLPQNHILLVLVVNRVQAHLSSMRSVGVQSKSAITSFLRAIVDTLGLADSGIDFKRATSKVFVTKVLDYAVEVLYPVLLQRRSSSGASSTSTSTDGIIRLYSSFAVQNRRIEIIPKHKFPPVSPKPQLSLNDVGFCPLQELLFCIHIQLLDNYLRSTKVGREGGGEGDSGDYNRAHDKSKGKGKENDPRQPQQQSVMCLCGALIEKWEFVGSFNGYSPSIETLLPPQSPAFPYQNQHQMSHSSIGKGRAFGFDKFTNSESSSRSSSGDNHDLHRAASPFGGVFGDAVFTSSDLAQQQFQYHQRREALFSHRMKLCEILCERCYRHMFAAAADPITLDADAITCTGKCTINRVDNGQFQIIPLPPSAADTGGEVNGGIGTQEKHRIVPTGSVRADATLKGRLVAHSQLDLDEIFAMGGIFNGAGGSGRGSRSGSFSGPGGGSSGASVASGGSDGSHAGGIKNMVRQSRSIFDPADVSIHLNDTAGGVQAAGSGLGFGFGEDGFGGTVTGFGSSSKNIPVLDSPIVIGAAAGWDRDGFAGGGGQISPSILAGRQLPMTPRKDGVVVLRSNSRDEEEDPSQAMPYTTTIDFARFEAFLGTFLKKDKDKDRGRSSLLSSEPSGMVPLTVNPQHLSPVRSGSREENNSNPAVGTGAEEPADATNGGSKRQSVQALPSGRVRDLVHRHTSIIESYNPSGGGSVSSKSGESLAVSALTAQEMDCFMKEMWEGEEVKVIGKPATIEKARVIFFRSSNPAQNSSVDSFIRSRVRREGDAAFSPSILHPERTLVPQLESFGASSGDLAELIGAGDLYLCWTNRSEAGAGNLNYSPEKSLNLDAIRHIKIGQAGSKWAQCINIAAEARTLIIRLAGSARDWVGVGGGGGDAAGDSNSVTSTPSISEQSAGSAGGGAGWADRELCKRMLDGLTAVVALRSAARGEAAVGATGLLRGGVGAGGDSVSSVGSSNSTDRGFRK